MVFSLGNDQLHYLLPPAKCKTLFNPASAPHPFFTFPNPLPLFPPRPRFVCRATSADAATLPQSAIQRIAEKLRSLGYVEEDKDKDKDRLVKNGPSPGEIFVPLPRQLPKYRVGHTLDPSWSTPENPVPLPGSGKAIQKYHELRRGVIKERIEERKKREKVPTLAELTLPEKELRRLRTLGIGLEKKLKVGKAGITEGIVNGIHERWRRYEVVKIRCEDICRMNMKRTHELLEMKTGGLVVWRSGTNIVLYRGADYKYPYFSSGDNSKNGSSNEAALDVQMDYGEDGGRQASSSDGTARTSYVLKSLDKVSHPPLIQGVGSPNRVRFQLPGEAQLAEEADRLLEGLGPRFSDWWGYEPLPVDADLLPAVVPEYRRPFRLLPYGVKHILTNDEMTILRRLGRPLPCHFALGRNRNLQGLAASIIKLWEKCEIAKIAIKRGVQNTNSELMAEELKLLTGGTLLSRDKEFIVLYRGKDFLPVAVSSAIEEQRKYGLDGEKKGADKSSTTVSSKDNRQQIPEHVSGGEENNGRKDEKSERASEQRHLSSRQAAIEKTTAKLSKALAKKSTAEKLLAVLDREETSQEPEIDKEGITEEERYMLRKVGLRMDPFLLLGRRGVFAGTIENMHLHWKYRELVKIITGGRSIEEVHGVARTLEAESGGILVAVERVSKGYAIIVYRGKNYSRPACLRPRSLLSKREAMKRSIEAQRRESLKLHVLKLTQHIDNLKLQLAKDEERKKMQLAKEFKLELDEEHEINKLQSAENEMSLASPEVCLQSLPGIPCNQQTLTQTISSVSGTTEARLVGNKPLQLSGDSPKTELDPSVHGTVSGFKPIPCRAKSLSNRERLLLRKQALKMKKHPLFAIGKSNMVTGVAEAIKLHFKRYPLAIVNVKGRAKGTSVQELVLMLEQATGAVLVSQEPSKVILYRGSGAGEESNHGSPKPTTTGSEGRTPSVISQELISAIRLECGLQQSYNEKESAP
ncbi:hypothetical protein ACH5RR_011115 [Cinchona calisaya]|uniref:CRM domain-containing protein n=1 Tax=Cinchona calisaya TaxID=153742 RepID=A0ABD3A5E6_9GENT